MGMLGQGIWVGMIHSLERVLEGHEVSELDLGWHFLESDWLKLNSFLEGAVFTYISTQLLGILIIVEY